MPDDATRGAGGRPAPRLVAWVALAVVVLGVFSTWTTDGPVTLNGTQGPNNGWLVLIVAAFALAWTWPMARGSWVGIVGVLGAAVVMGWTAIESGFDGQHAGASVSYGLLLVVAASAALVGTAVVCGVEVARRPRGPAP